MKESFDTALISTFGRFINNLTISIPFLSTAKWRGVQLNSKIKYSKNEVNLKTMNSFELKMFVRELISIFFWFKKNETISMLLYDTAICNGDQ